MAKATGAEEVVIQVVGMEPLLYSRGELHPIRRIPDSMVLFPLGREGWLGLRGAGEVNRRFLEDYCLRAIENARRYECLLSRSMVDALTGLPDRAAFQEKFEEEVRKHYRLCLLFVDLDGFKKVNDTLGHVAGDRVLKRAADAMRECLRRTDFLARYGGDEFVVLLPGTPPEGGEVVASRLAQLSFEEGGIAVGVSVGLAVYPDDGETLEELIGTADTRMYARKKGGRS